MVNFNQFILILFFAYFNLSINKYLKGAKIWIILSNAHLYIYYG